MVVPTTFLGASHDDVVRELRFKEHWLDGGDVVAIFEISEPDRFVIVYDFRDNASWPRQDASHLSMFGPLMGKDLDAESNRVRIEAAYEQ